mgnify:CR=1 FL=1
MATDITPSSAPQCPDHIVFEHVTKEFRTRSGTVRALDDVSLAIKRGSISAVIGHSGAGKSTLVRLINGLETPTRGRVLVDGTDVSQLSDKAMRPLRADIGMIFQQFNLLTPLNVKQNIAFPLHLNQQKWNDWCDYLVETLGINQLLERHVSALSGGQQQRVAIARALAHQPKLLLADEPTGNLDQKAGIEVMKLLSEITIQGNTAVLLVTHSNDCAEFMQTRLRLENSELYNDRIVRPQNLSDVSHEAR